MGPNLKSAGINSLRLSCEISLTEALINQIHDIAPPDEEGDSIFVDSYKVNEISHRAFTWVLKPRGKATKFRIAFVYEIGRGGKWRKYPRINKLLDILSSIEEPITFSCQASLKLGRGAKAKPIVNLPMRWTQAPYMPFNEIHGLHLVKLNGKEIEHEIILDLVTTKELKGTVFFSYNAKVHALITHDIFNKAVKISESFVLKG